MFGFFNNNNKKSHHDDESHADDRTNEHSDDRDHHRHGYDMTSDDHEENDDDDEEEEVTIEASLIPSDQEKRALLASFDTMRKDSLFCDVAFVCRGTLFRAHRVVISSWSRWMRTFLIDSPPEEVLSMDIFEPKAFQAVIDYMYGQPLYLKVEVRLLNPPPRYIIVVWRYVNTLNW